MAIKHRNPYFNVEFKNDYYQINFPFNHVSIIAYTRFNELVVVKAKRPILKKSIFEFPSGNPNNFKERPIDAASRELFEETGIQILNKKRFKKYPVVNSMPARTTNIINHFSVKITRQEFFEKKKHDNEVESVVLISLRELLKKISKGQFFVTAHLALLLFYLLEKKKIKG